jgi:hypothetical protein
MPGGKFLVLTFAVAMTIWLGGLLLVVAYNIVGGRISLRGLLTETLTGQMAAFSRPQMLFVSLAAAATYVGKAIEAIGTTNTFPPVPTELVAAVAGSQAVFIGGKWLSSALSKLRAPGAVK